MKHWIYIFKNMYL